MQSWVIKGTRKIAQTTIESANVDLDKYSKIKISRASISKSDIASFSSKNTSLNIIPARSAIGFISESRNHSLKKGQRVFLSPYVSTNDGIKICGRDVNGYLSDFAIAPNKNIFSLPEGLNDEAFSFIEDVALAITACEKLEIKPTQYVLINGASDLNLIVAQICLYHQAIPIVVDTDDECLSIAEEYGIYYTINSSKKSLETTLNEITSGALASQLVIDFDAFPEIDPDILNLVSHNAKVVIMGYDTLVSKAPIDLSYALTKHLSIYGCNSGANEIEAAINLIVTGIIKVDKLFDGIYDFEETKTAFIEASSKRCRFKTLIRC